MESGEGYERNRRRARNKEIKYMGVKECGLKSERLSMTFPLWLPRHIVTSGPPAIFSVTRSRFQRVSPILLSFCGCPGHKCQHMAWGITRAKSARLRLIAGICMERVEIKGSIIEKK